MSTQDLHALVLGYNELDNLFKNTHNCTNYLVYGFRIQSVPDLDQFSIEKAGHYQIQNSGKSYYNKLRVHSPKVKGTGYLSTGSIPYNSGLTLVKDKQAAEQYLELYAKYQYTESIKINKFYGIKLDYLKDFVFP